jgi:hypothetical protein
LSAACGEDDEDKKVTGPGDPLMGRKVCDLPNFFSVTGPEDLELLTSQDCDAIASGEVVMQGGLDSIEGFQKIKYIQGLLWIRGSNLTDITPLKNIEAVGALLIDDNEKLDNCQATALAATVRVERGNATVKNNLGSAICSTWP